MSPNAERGGRAAPPVGVDHEKIGALDAERAHVRFETEGFHLRGWAEAEDPGVAAGGDRRAAGGLDDHRDPALLDLRHRRERHRITPGAHDRAHLAADDELLRRARRFRGVGLVVLDHQLEPAAAQHTAAGVESVARDLGAHADVVAGGGGRTGQRLDDADLDRRQHLQLRMDERRSRQQHRRDQHRQDQPPLNHRNPPARFYEEMLTICALAWWIRDLLGQDAILARLQPGGAR